MEDFSFDPDTHILTPKPNEEQSKAIRILRETLEKDTNELYGRHKEWVTDECSMRFLIARNFNLEPSLSLIKGALEWRDKRKPGEMMKQPNWRELMKQESATGKIYVPTMDRWNRPLVVLDNTVQNTSDSDAHMKLLAWTLEFSTKMMKPVADKYVVFVHLTNFSLFNCPPLVETRETIHMLCNCYPERLGHCIAYQPPAVFRTFFNAVKGWMDPKTVSKIHFVIGDVSEGSENDAKMRTIVGDNWKELTGAEQPVGTSGKNGSFGKSLKCSPGYNHDTYWKTIEEIISDMGSGTNEG